MQSGISDIEILDILADIQKQELQLWSLIEAQHGLKARMQGVTCKMPIQSHPMSQLNDSLHRTLQQYEMRAWHIVTIQMHLRLKFVELTGPQIVHDATVKLEAGEEQTGDGPYQLPNTDDGLQTSECVVAAITDDAEQKTAGDGVSSFVENPAAYDSIEQDIGQSPSRQQGKGLTAAEIHTCRVCQQQFRQRSMYLSHYRQFHPDAKAYACDECDSQFDSTVQLNTHKIAAHGGQRPFGCDLCHRRFMHSNDMKRHMDTHGEPVECRSCSKTFKCAQYLRAHMKLLHANEESLRKCLCDECGLAFRHDASLKQHMLQRHSAERPFGCTECNFRTISRSSLQRHAATHTHVRPFECSHCDKSFPARSNLKRHIQCLHTAVRPFACSHCPKKFPTNETCQIHERTHTGVKPYACAECGQRFGSCTQRSLHTKKVHTGERPHQCDICHERFFLLKHQLTKHMAQHTGIKPFVCDRCDERFASPSALSRHRQATHSDQPPVFKCSICAREYGAAHNLQRHMQTHTGQKPFSCEVCQKRFADIGTVKIHMRIHTGEKPFACDVCDRRFYDRRNMVKHKKAHAN